MPQKILVTGASGFIASHCIIDLLNHGYKVRGTVRNLSRSSKIKETLSKYTNYIDNLEFVELDLMKSEGWVEAATGCEGVFHIASPVPVVQPKDEDQIIKPAIEGTLNALKAADTVGIKRVILTSSISAMAYGRPERDLVYTEKDWTNIDAPNVCPYYKSKTLAEKAAWDFVKHTQIKLTTISPGVVFGPALEGDYGTSLQILLDSYRRKHPLIPNIGFEIVDVRDVAMLHRLTYEKPESAGRRFICTSSFMWFKEIIDTIHENFPKSKRASFVMPDFLFNFLAPFIDELKMIAGESGKTKKADNSSAIALGWRPRPVEEAITSGINSLLELGLLD